jgi:transposase
LSPAWLAEWSRKHPFRVRRVPGSNSKQPPALHLLECLKHREADVLRFLSDTSIPPTSNQAERDLRPAKTEQKIFGQLLQG